MNRTSLVASLTAILVVVAIAAGALVLGAEPRLGLDLRGGISAVYQPDLETGPVPDDLDAALDTAIELIRARVDSLGVAEPDIARQGNDILVQLPGIDDPERAAAIIGQTAQLTFHPVESLLVPGTPEYDQTPSCFLAEGSGEDVVYVLNPERPSAQADGIACEAVEDPNDRTPAVTPTEDAEEPTGEPTEESTGEATDEPTDGEPTPTPTDDDLPAGAPRPLKYVLGDLPTDDEGDPLTGDDIEDAFPTTDATGWVVQLDLDGDGGAAFADITSELACERDQGTGPGQLAIVLDDVVESAPTMSAGVLCGQGITGGSATITVGGGVAEDAGQAEAIDLSLVLDVGALPLTLQEATFETVSPTLGSASLRNGLLAGLVGLVLVGIYLLYFYRALGLIAIGGLAVFGVLIVGMIAAMGELGFALTLAGIAGVIVAIGITADSSIIFFERIRDEVALGKSMRSAVSRGFRAAFRTNLAGNTVTLAAALILYFLAVGPVRGFALTLGLATVLDIFILWAYSRSVIGLLAGSKRLTRKSVRVRAATGGSR